MAVHCAQVILIQLFLVSRFVVVYFQMEAQFSPLLHIMYFAFTYKKQVSKGLLTGDQNRTFLLSKRELCLHELKRLSLTQCTEQY